MMIVDEPHISVGNENIIEIKPFLTGHSGHEDMSNHGVSNATINEMALEAARDSID
ncbi:hypothetical protein MKX01_025043, partial [Papaver californicum]